HDRGRRRQVEGREARADVAEVRRVPAGHALVRRVVRLEVQDAVALDEAVGAEGDLDVRELSRDLRRRRPEEEEA
ncbi:hypothetical protein THAOC_25172, partial [Thalassiosira oceanica]